MPPWEKFQTQSGPWDKYKQPQTTVRPDRFDSAVSNISPRGIGLKEDPYDNPNAPPLGEERKGTYRRRFFEKSGLDPNLRRGTILPIARDPKTGEVEAAIPQIGVQLMGDAAMPGAVHQGERVTGRDVTEMAFGVGPMGSMRGRVPLRKKEFIKGSPTEAALKSESQSLYKKMEDRGVRLSGDSLDQGLAKLDYDLNKAGANSVQHPEVLNLLKLWREESVNKLLPMEKVETMRSQALAFSRHPDSDIRRLGSMMVDSIDDFTRKIDTGAITSTGNAKGVARDLRRARNLWARKRKVSDIEEIFFKAENSASGLENGLRNGFRALINNPKKRRGYSDTEIRAMQRVVNGGSIDHFLRAVRHLGPGAGTENRMLGTYLGAGMGATVGAHMGGPIGAGIGSVTVPAVGHLAGRAAQHRTIKAGELAKALAASGSNPNLDTLRQLLMRQGGRRLTGAVLGAESQR